MANSLDNLKPWKKGQSGNPAGPPKLPAEIRAERRSNQAALIRLVITYFALTDEQAAERMAGPETNQLEVAVQGMIGRAKEGDTNAFKYLTELICGKIPETDPDDSHPMTPEETIEAMERAIAVLKNQVKRDDDPR